MSTNRLKVGWLQMVLVWQLSSWFFIMNGIAYFRSISSVAGLDIYDADNKVLAYANSNYILVEGLLFGFCFGTLFYFIDMLSQNTKIRYMSFGRIILIRSLLYFVGFVIVFVVVAGVLLQFDFFPFRSFSDFVNVIASQHDIVPMFLSQIVLTIIAINFIKEVSRKFGPGNLWNLFIGKYHHPIEENRIFMFLDLKDSTRHAEELGHIKYSELIQKCFLYLNDLVAKHNGQIYQYVGDEVVLTWDMKNKKAVKNSLELYYKFQDLINNKAQKFEEKFGFVPEFKAGINEGLVTVAEVGNIKREIAYHGDVLNTGSRIQEQCNKFGKKLLISEVLANKMNDLNQFRKELIGKLSLKGKTELINVYSVERA